MSKEALESFLQQELETGRLTCKKFTVLDMQEWRARAHSDYAGETIQARGYSWFQYYVLGRLATIRSARALRRRQPKPAPEQPVRAKAPTQAESHTALNATPPSASTQAAHGKTAQKQMEEQAAIASGPVTVGKIGKVVPGSPMETVGRVADPTPTVNPQPTETPKRK